MASSQGCNATREAVFELEEDGQYGCPICGLSAVAHVPELLGQEDRECRAPGAECPTHDLCSDSEDCCWPKDGSHGQ